MDSLTSFLLSEHGEMSLDAFTDNMLANLPHQREQFDAFTPIIPFSSELIKNSGFPNATTKEQTLPQQPIDPVVPLLWDLPLPSEPLDSLGMPLVMSAEPIQPVSDPVFAQSQQAPFGTSAPVIALPTSVPLMELQTSELPASRGSPDRSDDPEIIKLQERVQRQKEKNARNQRQFRKRAKEKAVKIEEQVQQLSAKLRAMEMEKQSLLARNKILETALGSAKTMATKSNMGLPLATMLAAACEGGQPEMFDAVLLQARGGAPLTLSVEQLQRMTWTELSAIWKEYINAIAMALVTSNSSLEGSSGQRLKDLVSDVSTLMRGVAMHNAKLVHQHNSRRMDVHSLQEQQPPAGFYTKIMEMLQLTKEQKEQILAHRHIKICALARLVLERKELQARLKACNEATAHPVENVPCLGMGPEFPHLVEVAERLNENVAQLHRSVCLFMGQTWRQVLTPIQAGTFMVQSFPWSPDALALANAIAQEANAPSVKHIFDEVLSSPPSSGLHLAL